MTYQKILLSLLICTAISPIKALADDSYADLATLYGDESMIGIATGTQKPLHLAPAVANVITAQDIEKMGATTLEEALEQIPGLHASISSVKDFRTIFSIRGIHTDWNPQVLITINGIPVKDPNTNSRLATYRLPTSNISRIEVIRGPSSAVHGADAFSGVINIVTKSANELNGLHSGIRLGSFDSQQGWLQYGGQISSWNIALSLEHQRSNGDPDRKLDVDAASGLNSSLAQRHPLQTQYNIWNTRAELSDDNWNISLAHWQQNKAGNGPGVAQAIDPEGWQIASTSELDISYKLPKQIAGWELSSRVNYQRIRDNNSFLILPANTMLPIGDDGNIGTAPNSNCPDISALGIPNLNQGCLTLFPNGVYGNPGLLMSNALFEVSGLYNDISDHTIRLNLGATQYKVDKAWETKNFGPNTPAALIGENAATTTIPNTNIPLWVVDDTLTDVSNTSGVFMNQEKRNAWYIAAQDEWQFAPDWTFTGGARYDHFSDFGDTFNPRAALVWATNYNLTSKFLLGSAFRAPSFTELHIKNNPSVVGNPDLKPEKIHTAELAFEYRPNGDWRHNANIYYYLAKDLIDYDSARTSQNLRKQTGTGFELESHWQVAPTLQLGASYAWQHSKDQTSHNATPNAPGNELSANMSWQPGYNWTLYSGLNYISNRHRAVGDNRSAVGNYTLVNFTARKQITRNLDLSLLVRNLFDKQAYEPSIASAAYTAEDYPLEGRNGFLELRYQINK